MLIVTGLACARAHGVRGCVVEDVVAVLIVAMVGIVIIVGMYAVDIVM